MQYSTDDLMFSIHRCLRNDMRYALGMDSNGASSVFNASTAIEIRHSSLLLHEGLHPYVFKWSAQVNSFLKRYTFQEDLYTPQEREELTNAKFIQLQETLAISYLRQRTVRCHKVISLARKIARRILDKVVLQELPEASGRFGTKATVGCARSQSYVDEKLLASPVTGSAGHIQWFKEDVLPSDPLLADIVSRNSRGYQTIECLTQVNVPKSYKVDRGINPDTLLGSLRTNSIGKLIERALKLEGLDIRRLQREHGKLARIASYRNKSANTKIKLVTADLSDASHGFLSNIINALLPRKWYRAVMRGVIRQVEVNGRVYRLESIMTMGIGFTFPMQTLLFYCLLKAISILSNVEGVISVYGDDLIYPQDMHPYVVGIFKDLGFKLNLDKTFVNSGFKESCGADFFKGVDVRPYSPEGTSSTLGKWQYVAFCYQLINGFLHRWNEWEIKTTITTLLWEIQCATDGLPLFTVPHDAPDFSGIRLTENISAHSLQNFGVCAWTFEPHLFSYAFPALHSIIPRHFVTDHSPYYWDWLRQNSEREFSWDRPLLLPDIIGTAVFSWRRRKDKSRRFIKRRYVTAKKWATVADKSGDLVTRYEVRRKHA